MKNIFIFSLLITFFSCNNSSTSREMSALEAFGQIKNDFCILVDIREKGTYSKTAEMAHNLPLSEIENKSSDINSLFKTNISDKTIVIFSNNTDHSLKACAIFIKANYKCSYLKDFSEWEANNLPTRNI